MIAVTRPSPSWPWSKKGRWAWGRLTWPFLVKIRIHPSKGGVVGPSETLCPSASKRPERRQDSFVSIVQKSVQRLRTFFDLLFVLNTDPSSRSRNSSEPSFL